MRSYSFYRAHTGEIADRVYSTDDPQSVLDNTPDGHKAIEGKLDSRSQRIDVSTGMPVDYQPPQPSEDHEWDHGSKRWRLNSAAMQRAIARDEARAAIRVLEREQVTVIRKAVLGDTGARLRLAQIDDELNSLKAKQE